MPVRFQDIQTTSFRFFITEQGDSLMGVDLFDTLGGTVTLASTVIGRQSSLSTVTAVSSGVLSSTWPSTSVSLTQFPVLLKSSGQLRGFVHKPRIDLSVKPVQQKFWHPPLAMREPIAKKIDRLLSAGVIERIESSPWISNIATARKKDGGVRLCINMTAANQALIPECFPLPTMEELTAKVAGCTVFSKLDLLWGYTQLELDSEAMYLTAFVSHVGAFQFKSVVFGMSTGPSAFQSVIRKLLDGLSGCTNILDDILVYGHDMTTWLSTTSGCVGFCSVWLIATRLCASTSVCWVNRKSTSMAIEYPLLAFDLFSLTLTPS